MVIDRTHRAWYIASVGILALSALIYFPYARTAPLGPRGGSFVGLLFGILGFAFMLFAGLLGARQRVPVWRLGRAATWMRGHLWLGTLSLPMILFHSGFRMGGFLTRLLIWLLLFTVVSGLTGAALQHFLPRLMSVQVPLETIYDELGSVRRQLLAEADQLVEHMSGPLDAAEDLASAPAEQPGLRAGGLSAGRATSVLATQIFRLPEIGHIEASPLRNFYLKELRPVLVAEGMRSGRRAPKGPSRIAFQNLRKLLTPAGQQSAEYLEDLYGEHQQLGRQEQLHRLLHGWLLVHVPLSLALLLLAAVHAVMALRF
jgi:hypothetical protein